MNENLRDSNNLFWKLVHRYRRDTFVKSIGILDEPGRLHVTKNEFFKM